MRILGIDPGYATIGFGLVEADRGQVHMLTYGAITTPAGMDFPRRLEMIYQDMQTVLQRYHPDVLSIEKLYFTNNKTTGIDVAQARGVILLSATQTNMQVYEYTPMQVKQSVVGYGKAEKKQVMEMTRILLHLPAVPKPDDTADALAMAITFCHTNGNQLNRFARRGVGPI